MRLWRGSDVTVLIPTIPGREALLQRALYSVSQQKIQPAAVVVEVDTGRTGAAATRNRALERVDTEWVAFLDDDDEMLPTHVKLCLVAANHTQADLVYTYPEFVGGHDPLATVDELGRFTPHPVNVPFGPLQEAWLRTQGNFIPVTNLVRTNAVKAVGGFPEPYSMDVAGASNDCEDALLLVKLLDAGARFYHYCGVRTWRYHVYGGNTGGRPAGRMHELDGRLISNWGDR